MVPITKGQKVKDDATLVVAAESGQYGDTDLLLCARVEAPETPTAMLAAQYILYGNVVYQYNTPEETGKAVYALDKNSTLDAVALYKEEEARRRARSAGTLEPESAAPAPDAIADAPPEDAPQDPAVPAPQDPAVPAAPPDTAASSTPPVADSAASSTPPAAESIAPAGGDRATSTPPVIESAASSALEVAPDSSVPGEVVPEAPATEATSTPITINARKGARRRLS